MTWPLPCFTPHPVLRKSNPLHILCTMLALDISQSLIALTDISAASVKSVHVVVDCASWSCMGSDWPR
jgi:hypothetical protein